MKKLSKTQLKCIESMKSDIDKARSYDTFEEYIIATENYLRYKDNPLQYLKDHWDYYKSFIEYYENYKKGIVLVTGYGKPTLNSLEKLGIVSVVEYSEYRKNGVIDWVKLNNY